MIIKNSSYSNIISPYLSKSTKDSKDWGIKLFKAFPAIGWINLKGNLGSGKTEIVRAMIQYACGKNITVPSPSYTIMNTYENSKNTFVHIDLFRLKNKEETFELDIESLVNSYLVFIEWSEKGFIKQPPIGSILINDESNIENQRELVWIAE